MRCINMRFENCINKKAFSRNGKAFFVADNNGFGNFLCGAICACRVGQLRLSSIKIAGYSRQYKCSGNRQRSLSLTRRCKICENRQFWVWTFCLL